MKLISTHTSAGQDGAFITEDSSDPEVIGYAYTFTPFLLGDTTGIDSNCSLNWRTKLKAADGSPVNVTWPPR